MVLKLSQKLSLNQIIIQFVFDLSFSQLFVYYSLSKEAIILKSVVIWIPIWMTVFRTGPKTTTQTRVLSSAPNRWHQTAVTQRITQSSKGMSWPESDLWIRYNAKLIQLCGYRRQCWLCLGQEEVDSPLDRHSLRNYWLSPCRCRGTAKWIHNECLQLWIDEKQKLDTSVAVKCSQCNTQYVLVFPPNGRLVDLIVWYENAINNGMNYTIFTQSVPLINSFFLSTV